MHIAIIGATGLVGQTLLQLLPQRQLPVTRLTLVASQQSLGKTLAYQGESLPLVSIEATLAEAPDVAFFAAGGPISREWAPQFAQAGTLVVDKSSVFRLEQDVPLVVPEVNGHTIGAAKLIANPNCSTSQLVMALHPLQQAFGLERVIVSTYQAVSGTGKAALAQLAAERTGSGPAAVYPHAIDQNVLPHCDAFRENGYTGEEMKLVHETRKILGLPALGVTATAVRVPVPIGHSESVNVTLTHNFTLPDVRAALAAMPGLTLQDDGPANHYPMPHTAAGHNDVFVGRIRRDESHPRALNLWVVADNLRKGAALNALQIAEYAHGLKVG